MKYLELVLMHVDHKHRYVFGQYVFEPLSNDQTTALLIPQPIAEFLVIQYATDWQRMTRRCASVVVDYIPVLSDVEYVFKVWISSKLRQTVPVYESMMLTKNRISLYRRWGNLAEEKPSGESLQTTPDSSVDH